MLPTRTARSSLLSRALAQSSRPPLSLAGAALRSSSSRASIPASSTSTPFPTPSLLRTPTSIRSYATAATPGTGGGKLNGLKMAMGGGSGAGEALKEFVSSISLPFLPPRRKTTLELPLTLLFAFPLQSECRLDPACSRRKDGSRHRQRRGDSSDDPK